MRMSFTRVPAVVIALAGVLVAQSTERLSVDSAGMQGNAESSFASISADGRFVAFSSHASNLVAGDTNAASDIFVRDRLLGTTTRVSVDSSGVQGNGDSSLPAISADGRYVAFASVATNLVPSDTNGVSDVFVHDRVSGTTVLASASSAGVQGNDASSNPSLSSDGRYVAFDSYASNLVAGDTNGFQDAFVRDMVAGTTICVSVNSAGVEGNNYSNIPSISGDGSRIAFLTGATNMGGANSIHYHVCLRDLSTSVTSLIDVNPSGMQGNLVSAWPSISADGRYVAFQSNSSDLVPGDTNITYDVFVRDLAAGQTTRISVSSAGAQAHGDSVRASMSSDGRFVAFMSFAPDLVPGDTNGSQDVFVRDRFIGTTQRVSVDSSGVEGDLDSIVPRISADGRFIAFGGSADNLVPGDTNGVDDVFLRDRGAASAFAALCFGDGSGGACPCANSGAAGHGCNNSIGTGGASLFASGTASLAADSVHLTTSGELPSALSIVLQGNALVAPVVFGDGLRCAGGALKRLYQKNASAGSINVPAAGDPSVSSRSAALGDVIPLGATRIYQVYYRDPNLVFCAGGFNATHAIAIAWGA